MVDDTSQESALREVADELGMPVDDGIESAVLAYSRELDDAIDELSGDADDPVEPSGVRSDDAYNALLAVYDTPRVANSSGSLDGVSVAIKDNIAVRGLPMTCGSTDVSYVPSFDATVVERLLDEGAHIVGKANMDAFAFGPAGEWSEFGRVHNPVAEGRVPGGSSSGSGAAVAGGLVDAALGTDTGGSVRVPAACCGLVGVKPSHHLVPRFGVVGNMPSTDTVGSLAPDVETATRVLAAIAGPDPRDPTSVLPGPGSLADSLGAFDSIRVGVVESTFDLVADPVADAIAGVADALRAHDGVTVEPVTVAIPETVEHAYSLMYGAEYAWLVRQSFVVRGEGTGYDPEWRRALAAPPYNAHVAERVLPGALLDRWTDGRSYVAARREAIRFTKRLTERFDRVDVLLTPTLRTLPPEYGAIQSAEDGLQYSLCKPFSLTGLPAVSVPAGSVDGLPVGAQVIAPMFEDGRALQCARVIERVTGGVDA
ncbi:amidase [Haloplanus litoreus]|uniref:Amidase n=1 Tax=Haloplanus litoreus TaxID=767515 RepID=A0ABD6A1R1_9EURY